MSGLLYILLCLKVVERQLVTFKYKRLLLNSPPQKLDPLSNKSPSFMMISDFALRVQIHTVSLTMFMFIGLHHDQIKQRQVF